jgi:hypothetical protein
MVIPGGPVDPPSLEDEEYKEDENDEPSFEPECTASEKEREELDIECEFEVRDGSWWCITHNCHA